MAMVPRHGSTGTGSYGSMPSKRLGRFPNQMAGGCAKDIAMLELLKTQRHIYMYIYILFWLIRVAIC